MEKEKKKSPPKKITYRIVKFCKLCKIRFFVPNGFSNKIYCETCEKKMYK